MLDTVGGLPAHPLFAHVVAIFLPLTALLAISWWFGPQRAAASVAPRCSWPRAP
jgi:hypothetical protein